MKPGGAAVLMLLRGPPYAVQFDPQELRECKSNAIRPFLLGKGLWVGQCGCIGHWNPVADLRADAANRPNPTYKRENAFTPKAAFDAGEIVVSDGVIPC